MVHCRVSRSVEVPSGTPSVVYTAKEHPTRAAAGAAAAATIAREGIESADNNERVPQCVPVVRGFLVVTRRAPLSWLLFARRRLDVTHLRVTASKMRVDSFHDNNVKMGNDARAYAAEKFTRIMARHGAAYRWRARYVREFQSELRLAAASRLREIWKKKLKTHHAASRMMSDCTTMTLEILDKLQR